MSIQQIIKNTDGFTFELKHLELEKPVNWHQAKTLCDELGNEWRLPTKSELIMIYKQ